MAFDVFHFWPYPSNARIPPLQVKQLEPLPVRIIEVALGCHRDQSDNMPYCSRVIWLTSLNLACLWMTKQFITPNVIKGRATASMDVPDTVSFVPPLCNTAKTRYRYSLYFLIFRRTHRHSKANLNLKMTCVCVCVCVGVWYTWELNEGRSTESH